MRRGVSLRDALGFPTPRRTPKSECSADPRGLPTDDPAPDPRLHCKPDRLRGIECEPRISLAIPIKLGPRTTLYDVSFDGDHAPTEASLLEAADLELGRPASYLRLEQARRQILQTYKELGFAYAEVRAPSNCHLTTRGLGRGLL